MNWKQIHILLLLFYSSFLLACDGRSKVHELLLGQINTSVKKSNVFLLIKTETSTRENQ